MTGVCYESFASWKIQVSQDWPRCPWLGILGKVPTSIDLKLEGAAMEGQVQHNSLWDHRRKHMLKSLIWRTPDFQNYRFGFQPARWSRKRTSGRCGRFLDQSGLLIRSIKMKFRGIATIPIHQTKLWGDHWLVNWSIIRDAFATSMSICSCCISSTYSLLVAYIMFS